LFLVFSMGFVIQVRPVRISVVERELGRIVNKYGPRMAWGRSWGATAAQLESMENLAKVADELGKTILYKIPETPEVQYSYFVVDGFTTYSYRIPANGQSVAADTKVIRQSE
jgi:hypothetical protein